MNIYSRFPETFIVVEKDNIIGYMMSRIEKNLFSFSKLGTEKNGHVISIAVLPDHRNKGVGKALIKETLRALTRYQAEKCYLEVRVSNIPAINLYKSLGFKRNKILKGYYLDGENAYLMEKRISSQETEIVDS